MAKLGAFYSLCPLIDHRSLLGISSNSESGKVIVTLGKNIAIKYKLSDQKQLHSWRSKQKFTSPIIYDEQENRYVAVFNQSYLRVWNGDEEFLDKLKKYKFKKQIYTIFVCKNKSFILFKNGAIKPLNEAIEDRKNLDPDNVIDENLEQINDVLYTHLNEDIYIGLLTKAQNVDYLIWTKFDNSGQQQQFCKIMLNREGCELTGYVLHVHKTSVNFLSLWTDCRVFSYPLMDPEVNSPGELFTVIESIICKHYVSIVSLDENYIAMYGGNCNEEGALLIIYNVQFKVIQSKQPFKMFTKGAKLWRVEDRLFVAVGQHLAVVPFYLDTAQVAALVGSHKVIEVDPDICIINKLEIRNWSNSSQSDQGEIPKAFKQKKANKRNTAIKEKMLEFWDQGLPENIIFEELLPELVEKKDVEGLYQCIQYFSDIPEKYLAKLLKLILSLKLPSGKTVKSEKCPPALQPLKKARLVDLLLSKSFSEELILRNLKVELGHEEVLTLIRYIYFLLCEGHTLPSCNFVQTEAKLSEWGCVLLDANYQNFLVTKDKEVIEMLLLFNSLIDEELNCIDSLKQLTPMLNKFKTGKPIYKSTLVASSSYSIEQLNLY